VKGLNCSASSSFPFPAHIFLIPVSLPHRLQTLCWDKSFVWDSPFLLKTFPPPFHSNPYRIVPFPSVPIRFSPNSSSKPNLTQANSCLAITKKNRWSADFHFVRFKNLSTLRWFPHIIIRPNRRQSSQQQQQQQEQTFDNT